jgi:copper chaperone NosL
MRRLTSTPALALIALLATTACQRGPRPLVAGTDACDFCRMTISDVRFGAELMSRTGRVHTFDAIECLASFYLDAEARDDVRSVWVADFESGRLVTADSAVFLQGGSLRSPMGRSLVAFAAGSDTQALVRQFGGSILSWSSLLAQLRQERLGPGAERSHDHAAHGGSQ